MGGTAPESATHVRGSPPDPGGPACWREGVRASLGIGDKTAVDHARAATLRRLVREGVREAIHAFA